MTSRRFPDFYILGAPKAGTSSLAQYLDEHPGILISDPKEPRYFAEDFADRPITDANAYLALFEKAGDGVLLGEGTTDYLTSEVAVDRILDVRPDARFIAMLRNPVQIVFAMHAQERKNGYETVPDPADAWALIEERKAGRQVPVLCEERKRLLYDERCMLGVQIERLLSKVQEDRLKIIFMEDFSRETERLYRETLAFLGVEDDGRRDFPVYNQRHHIRHPAVIQLWKLGMSAKDKLGLKTHFGLLSRVQKMGMSSEPVAGKRDHTAFRDRLRDYFEDDIRHLAKLTGRDLSSWLERETPPVETTVAAAAH